MTPFFTVMAALFAGQMSLALFLMFGAPGVPWYKRVVAAFGSVGMAISLFALFFAPKQDDPFSDPNFSMTTAIGLLIINATLAFRLFTYFRNRETQFSCLGTIGRLVGCVFVAWGVFAFVTLGIALLIGLVSFGPAFFTR